MGNQPICSERIAQYMVFLESCESVLVREKANLNRTLDKEITFSCKIILQAILKLPVPLKSPLDIVRPVPIQYLTCDCLYQRPDDAHGSWHLAQDRLVIVTLSDL